MDPRLIEEIVEQSVDEPADNEEASDLDDPVEILARREELTGQPLYWRRTARPILHMPRKEKSIKR